MFSLCIPTMDRYDKYLSIYLPKYLNNPLINEIVICDENGNDVRKIETKFNNNKLKLYINDVKKGPFLNKVNVCSKASNEWIALIDSDNFADLDYFENMKNYIENNTLTKNTILSPDYGSTIFHWEHLSHNSVNVISKDTYNQLKVIDDENSKKHNGNIGNIGHLMNTGNYIINKYLIENINLDSDIEMINNSDCFDVVLFNLLCFEQMDLQFYVVKDVKYNHITSDDSIYIRTIGRLRDRAKNTYNRLWQYLKH